MKDYCFFKSKLITAAFQLKPWTLWTVHAHDSIDGNCVLCIVGDAVLYLLRYIDTSSLSIGNHLLFLAIISLPLILVRVINLSSQVKYIVDVFFFLFVSRCKIVLSCPLVNLSDTLIFAVIITLVSEIEQFCVNVHLSWSILTNIA